MRIIEWNCQGAFRLKNKEILEKIFKSHNNHLSTVALSKGTKSNKFRAISCDLNKENTGIFTSFSYIDKPFLSGMKSIFEIFENNFICKMQEMADIHLEEALLSDSYKVQIDMRIAFEKLRIDVPRKRKETSSATSE